jgi:hypothetical protein
MMLSTLFDSVTLPASVSVVPPEITSVAGPPVELSAMVPVLLTELASVTRSPFCIAMVPELVTALTMKRLPPVVASTGRRS